MVNQALVSSSLKKSDRAEHTNNLMWYYIDCTFDSNTHWKALRELLHLSDPII